MIPIGLYQPGNEMENGLNVIVRSPTHNRAIIHIDINKEEFYKLKYCSTVVYMVPRA